MFTFNICKAFGERRTNISMSHLDKGDYKKLKFIHYTSVPKNYCNRKVYINPKMLYYYLCSTFVLLSAFVVLKRVKTGQKVAMGSWLTYLWWGGDPDLVNPMSGLTKREVYAIQQSWAPVYANPVANGTELLRRLFHSYPETKEFFKMVRKSSEEEYTGNPQFRAHVINLMSSLNLAVSNLNQPEVVAAMMNKLGESHGRRRIQEKHFNDLKDVIVKMFIEVLKLDGNTLGAWGKAVDFWYKHIFETLKQGEAR